MDLSQALLPGILVFAIVAAITQATGGNGTPWSIVVGTKDKKYPLSGAQPYASVKQLIDLALQEK